MSVVDRSTLSERGGVHNSVKENWSATANLILEAHKPNDIIFECSKEWTINQTPELRDKERSPFQAAQPTETEIIVEEGKKMYKIIPSAKKRKNSTLWVNCQKKLFESEF